MAEARRRHDAGESLKEIATAMGMSDVTARKYLRQSFAGGQPMPDLRCRAEPHPADAGPVTGATCTTEAIGMVAVVVVPVIVTRVAMRVLAG